jgi:hypothetical protein
VVQTVAAIFVVGSLLVLVVDAALHLALAAVRVGETGLPWWVNAHVVERSVWVVMALLLWLGSRGLGAGAGTPGVSRAAAARLVGGAMIAVPIAWFTATVVVLAVRITARASWPVDGRIFLEPYYYSNAILTHAPWMLAGVVLVAASRHLPD